jgi:hypothetical protein
LVMMMIEYYLLLFYIKSDVVVLGEMLSLCIFLKKKNTRSIKFLFFFSLNSQFVLFDRCTNNESYNQQMALLDCSIFNFYTFIYSNQCSELIIIS